MFNKFHYDRLYFKTYNWIFTQLSSDRPLPIRHWIFILVLIGLRQKFGKYLCMFTRNWKTKIISTAKKEKSKSVSTKCRLFFRPPLARSARQAVLFGNFCHVGLIAKLFHPTNSLPITTSWCIASNNNRRHRN